MKRWAICYTAFLFMFLTAHTVVFLQMIINNPDTVPSPNMVLLPPMDDTHKFSLRILFTSVNYIPFNNFSHWFLTPQR